VYERSIQQSVVGMQFQCQLACMFVINSEQWTPKHKKRQRCARDVSLTKLAAAVDRFQRRSFERSAVDSSHKTLSPASPPPNDPSTPTPVDTILGAVAGLTLAKHSLTLCVCAPVEHRDATFNFFPLLLQVFSDIKARLRQYIAHDGSAVRCL